MLNFRNAAILRLVIVFCGLGSSLGIAETLPQKTVFDTVFTKLTLSGEKTEEQLIVNSELLRCDYLPRKFPFLIDGVEAPYRFFNIFGVGLGRILDYASNQMPGAKLLSYKLLDIERVSESCFVIQNQVLFTKEGVSLDQIKLLDLAIGSIEVGITPGFSFKTCEMNKDRIYAQAMRLHDLRMGMGINSFEQFAKFDNWYQDGYSNYTYYLADFTIKIAKLEECNSVHVSSVIMHAPFSNPEVNIIANENSFSLSLKRVDTDILGTTVFSDELFDGQTIKLTYIGKLFANYQNLNCFDVLITDKNQKVHRINTERLDPNFDKAFQPKGEVTITLPATISSKVKCPLHRISNPNPNAELELNFTATDKL